MIEKEKKEIEQQIAMLLSIYKFKKKKDTDYDKLKDAFKKLGAKNYELWAKSQYDEGINQLARFIFLKKAWELVIDESSYDWIINNISYYNKNENSPFAGLGKSLENILNSDVKKEDLLMLIRNVQAEMLSNVCDLLDNSESGNMQYKGMNWKLFQVNENGIPIDSIDGLHESILDLDPTGKEMCL